MLVKYNFFLILFGLLLFSSCGNAPDTDTATEASSDAEISSEIEEKPGKVVFFGNSLTAGNGLELGEDFPSLIQAKLEEAGYNYQVVNAGVSGETSAGGNDRVDWILQQNVDIFVLELGGNDGLRGIDPQSTYRNLQAIIDKVLAKAPEAQIVLAGMEAPPNMGQGYTSAFRNVYTRLADENNLPLIPFLLEGVGGIPELNLPDGIHPNVEGQKIVAENVWEVLRPVVAKEAM